MLDSQHPEGWEKMRELESRRRVAKLEVEEHAITAPKFLKSLQGVTTLEEGQNAHFEAQVLIYITLRKKKVPISTSPEPKF